MSVHTHPTMTDGSLFVQNYDPYVMTHMFSTPVQGSTFGGITLVLKLSLLYILVLHHRGPYRVEINHILVL